MKTHHWLPGLFVDSLQNKYNFFDIHIYITENVKNY